MTFKTKRILFEHQIIRIIIIITILLLSAFFVT